MEEHIDPVLKYCSNKLSGPCTVIQLVECRASIPEIGGSIPTVAGQNFQLAQYGFHSE